MIEIGKPKTIPVRVPVTGQRGRFTAKKDAQGQIETKTFPGEVWRMTRTPLSGAHGKDRGRKLTVGLVATDVLVLRVYGTRRVYSASLLDVYHWMVRSATNKVQLEKARITKARRAAVNAARRIQAAEKRLVR